MRFPSVMLALLILFFTAPSFAQSREKIDPKLMKEVEELYERRDEVRTFIFSMMERKLVRDMVLSLASKNFSESEIQTVLQSSEFKSFTKKVVEHPVVTKRVNHFVNVTLHPERIQKIFLRRKASWRTAQTTQLVMMLRSLLMERQLRLPPEEEEAPGFFTELWASVQGIFQEQLN